MSLFIDSSVFFAAANSKDKHNVRAKTILIENQHRITSDHILVETWLLLNSRIGRTAAERFWGSVRAGLVRIEKVLSADLEAAWRIGEAHPDQSFSIVDRTSFAIMERIGNVRAASFDDDFAVYRFGYGRSKAFEIVR